MCSKNMCKAIVGKLVRQNNIPEDLIITIYEYADDTFLKRHKKMILSLEQEYASYIYYFYNYALAPWIIGNESEHWKSMSVYYSNYSDFYDDIDNSFDNHYFALTEEIEVAKDEQSLLIKKNPFYKVMFEIHFTFESIMLCEELVHSAWNN
tara:strand:- start:7203 stop:7655 length:453 start_codon:yes stop_codon:yes gene_type:complete